MSIVLRDEARYLSGHGFLRILRTAIKAQKQLKLRGNLGVTFVRDRQMEKLGHGRTDVLAFPYDNVDVGDVFINVDHLKKTRKQHEWAGRTEELLVHALVHLSGHTHNAKSEYFAMRSKEIRVLGRPCLPLWEKRIEC